MEVQKAGLGLTFAPGCENLSRGLDAGTGSCRAGGRTCGVPRARWLRNRRSGAADTPVPIAVHDGRATFRAETRLARSEILVVVSAISRVRGPFPIELTARPASSPTIPDLADDGPVTETKTVVPPAPIAATSEAPSSPPGAERVFHMMVRDGDAASPSNYIAVRRSLKGVGREVQVYAAAEDFDQVGQELVSDIIKTFDDRILPLTSARFGRLATSIATAGSRSCYRAGSITSEVAATLSTASSESPTWTRSPRPLRQPLRHDVPEHGLEERAVPPHGAGPRVYARGHLQREDVRRGRASGA